MRAWWWLTLIAAVLAACTTTVDPAPQASDATAHEVVSASPTPTPTATPTSMPTPTDPDIARRVGPDISRPRPDWIGTRVLADGPSGHPDPHDTPPELIDRAFAPLLERLPVPSDTTFVGAVLEVAADVAARSTWSDGCPVTLDELRHVEVSFIGFDGLNHYGELLVHRDVADDMLEVFRGLHALQFPLEDLAIATTADLDAPATGDGNGSGGFVCRAAAGTTRWSAHARGLAIDLNPFLNPYVRDGRVIPELATAYTDRSDIHPGMIAEGDAVTELLGNIGWTWGGNFRSLTDPMHFSRDGT